MIVEPDRSRRRRRLFIGIKNRGRARKPPPDVGVGSRSGLLPRRHIDDRLGKLVGVPRALGVASHSGFLSGCLISSNEGTWMLSHHASSAAPQTVQTAPPVCGNKNFSSVRLYSAPQLHRTIVAILGICASNNSFSSGQSAFMRTIRCLIPTDPRPASDAGLFRPSVA